MKTLLSSTHAPVRREIGSPWRVSEFTLERDHKRLTYIPVMLLICVWLLWNKDRRVGVSLFILLVTGVSLGTGLRKTKPVRFPDEPPTSLYSPTLQPNLPSPTLREHHHLLLNESNHHMRKQPHWLCFRVGIGHPPVTSGTTPLLSVFRYEYCSYDCGSLC